MTLRSLATALVAATSLLVAAPPAARADVAPKEKARIHFKAGSSFLEIGEYDKAVAEYLEAYRLLPLPDFLFNIGQAYRLKGTPADRLHAAQYYRMYIKQRPDGVGVGEAKQHLAIIEREPGEIIKDGDGLWTDKGINPQPPPETKPKESKTVAVEPPPPPPPTVAPSEVKPAPSVDVASTPIAKKPAFWGGLVAGVVVVGAVVGISVGVGVGSQPSYPTASGGVIDLSLRSF